MRTRRFDCIHRFLRRPLPLADLLLSSSLDLAALKQYTVLSLNNTKHPQITKEINYCSWLKGDSLFVKMFYLVLVKSSDKLLSVSVTVS